MPDQPGVEIDGPIRVGPPGADDVVSDAYVTSLIRLLREGLGTNRWPSLWKSRLRVSLSSATTQDAQGHVDAVLAAVDAAFAETPAAAAQQLSELEAAKVRQFDEAREASEFCEMLRQATGGDASVVMRIEPVRILGRDLEWRVLFNPDTTAFPFSELLNVPFGNLLFRGDEPSWIVDSERKPEILEHAPQVVALLLERARRHREATQDAADIRDTLRTAIRTRFNDWRE